MHSFGCFVRSTNPNGSYICKGYNSNYFTVSVFTIYCFERIIHEYNARIPKTKLSKVILHSSETLEIRLEKSMIYKPGQYLYMNVPVISRFQWHPFTISSCPEEGFISVHIKIVHGGWTMRVAELLINVTSQKRAPAVLIGTMAVHNFCRWPVRRFSGAFARLQNIDYYQRR